MAPGHVFISHIEEDEVSAVTIAGGLESAGFRTWYFERDSNPGPSYLLQVDQAIKQSAAIVLLISPASIASYQMTKEVVRGHETGKPFIPVRFNISHAEFQRRQPEWSIAVGAASSIPIPVDGLAAILPRIIKGLRQLDGSGDAGHVPVAAAGLVSERIGRAESRFRSNEGTADGTGRLTPLFGITPGVTTRQEIEALLKAGALKPFGARKADKKNSMRFTYGVVAFPVGGPDYTRNAFDTVVSLEYWGEEPLRLGFSTKLDLDEAHRLAEEHFVWLGTQDFRGLVFSNRAGGPILLEISWMSERKNPLTYKVFGAL